MEPSLYSPRADELVALVGDLLGVSDLDADSNFIEEGGHSLQAVELDRLVTDRFGKTLDIELLFRGTLGEVADSLLG